MQKKCKSQKKCKKRKKNKSQKNAKKMRKKTTQPEQQKQKAKKKGKQREKKGLTTEPPGGTSKNCSTPVSKADLKFFNSLARQDFFLGVLPGELKNFRTALETGVLQFFKVRKN